MIIGLGHYAQTGKDTVGGILVDDHGFERVAFADALRDFVYRTDPVCRRIVDRMGWEEGKKVHPQHVRKPLIEVGNAARDILGPDVWIDAAFARVTNPNLAITDVRYPNEAREIKERGGIVVKVLRPGYEPLDNVADQAMVDYPDWDAFIWNDGSIEDLRAKVRGLLGAHACIS